MLNAVLNAFFWVFVGIMGLLFLTTVVLGFYLLIGDIMDNWKGRK